MTVLLVEDDAPFAEALAAELRACNHQVTIAGDGRAALACVDRDRFDAMILDRMLPRLDGISILERLRADDRTLPVIMLSARGAPGEKVEGLEAGADDYVVKPVATAELAARLQAVVRGRRWPAGGGAAGGAASADTLRAGDIVVSPSRFRAWRNDEPIDLVNLELKLLAEFVRNAGSVLTRAMLIERVWGYDFEPTTNLVDVYVRRLRQKLTANGADDPITTMRGVGYMLRG
ncbi:response regulator transcription factor [Sphingomonas sp. A2-49]|uniref:response regulator transcription factor n=1 Tax=Sphingomonas sp. A2-49 TaxID=1391375 RepID=UPI0021D2A147|nr:response regulator transcription factor [Sphingomonas sp. A2-49]MCU6456107.1 response regulator transcription factor [Sphingomonas sp. A2-49]